MEAKDRMVGERRRLAHDLDRMRASIRSLEIAMGLSGPIGAEAGEAIATCAVSIATTIAKHDAYELAGRR